MTGILKRLWVLTKYIEDTEGVPIVIMNTFVNTYGETALDVERFGGGADILTSNEDVLRFFGNEIETITSQVYVEVLTEALRKGVNDDDN